LKTQIFIGILITGIILQPYIDPKTAQSQSTTNIDETVAQCKVFKADDPLKTNLLQYEEKWISVPNRPYELTGFRNNTELIFEATLVNPFDTSVTLTEFRVAFYNLNGSSLFQGENNTFESPVTKIYSQKTAEMVSIGGLSCKTEQVKIELSLPYYELEAPPEEVGAAEQQVESTVKNETRAYLTQFTFEYDKGSSSSVNFTLYMLPEPTKKPVFLLYLIGGLTAIVLGMVCLAIYGRVNLGKKDSAS
jgi:hypothetical protein